MTAIQRQAEFPPSALLTAGEAILVVGNLALRPASDEIVVEDRACPLPLALAHEAFQEGRRPMPLWRDRLLGRCRARDGIDVSLYRLPMLLRGAFSSERPCERRGFPPVTWQPQNLCENCRQRRETPAGVLRRMRHVNLCVGIRKYDRAQLAGRGDKATIRDSAAPADLVLLGAFVDARRQNSALFA